jgi:hypothetical protein
LPYQAMPDLAQLPDLPQDSSEGSAPDVEFRNELNDAIAASLIEAAATTQNNVKSAPKGSSVKPIKTSMAVTPQSTPPPSPAKSCRKSKTNTPVTTPLLSPGRHTRSRGAPEFEASPEPQRINKSTVARSGPSTPTAKVATIWVTTGITQTVRDLQSILERHIHATRSIQIHTHGSNMLRKPLPRPMTFHALPHSITSVSCLSKSSQQPVTLAASYRPTTAERELHNHLTERKVTLPRGLQLSAEQGLSFIHPSSRQIHTPRDVLWDSGCQCAVLAHKSVAEALKLACVSTATVTCLGGQSNSCLGMTEPIPLALALHTRLSLEKQTWTNSTFIGRYPLVIMDDPVLSIAEVIIGAPVFRDAHAHIDWVQECLVYHPGFASDACTAYQATLPLVTSSPVSMVR